MALKSISAAPKQQPRSGAEHAAGCVLSRRMVLFAFFCLLPGAFFAQDVYRVFVLVLNDQTYSHIPLIPAISIYLFYTWRSLIFKRVTLDWKPGGALILAGILFLMFTQHNTFRLTITNQNSLLVFGFVLLWIGMFLLFFGAQAFHAALFPLFFLFFMVPIPQPFLSHIIGFLQEWSSNCAAWMFQLMGVPFLRRGFDFALPGVTIRVAEECSGIRSTLALIIVCALISRLFMRTLWSRALFCLMIVPLSIAKNGFRIAFLSTMAIYVDPSFLTGPLHHRGGIFFFILALIPLFLFLRLLQKLEGRTSGEVSPRSLPPADSSVGLGLRGPG